MSTESATAESANTVKPVLLFVDDERRVLTSMRAMFRRDYEVLLANSGDEAIELLAKRDDVHVVISDQRMPGMTGVELLASIKNDHPDSMRILLTGYADLEAVEASINESEVFRYLMKPCPPNELKEAVRLAVRAARIPVSAEVSRSAPDEIENTELTGLVDDSLVQEVVLAREVEVLDFSFDSDKALDASIEEAVTDAQLIDGDPNPEVLVLTQDSELKEGVGLAIDGQYSLREADSVESALQKLSEFPIGVLITDLAVDEREIDELTKTLKHEVPELVTIIASERSDAALLIELINHGQIFRFLLKPLQVGQTRIWLNSAVSRYASLCADNNTVLRHKVVLRNPDFGNARTGLFANVRARIKNIKERFTSSRVTSRERVRSE